MASGNEMKKGVMEVFGVAFVIVIIGIAMQVVLDLDVVTSLTIINATALSNAIGLFTVGLFALFSLAGTALGLSWAFSKFKTLFSKKDGITNIAA